MKRSILFACLIIFYCGWLIDCALAGSGVWSAAAPGTYDWGDATDFYWANNAVASGAGQIANFGAMNPTGDEVINLGTTPETVGKLIFGDTDPASPAGWTIAGGINSLTIDNGGVSGEPSITVNTLGAGKKATISAPLSGAQGFTKSGMGELVLTNAAGLTGGVQVNQGTVTLDFPDSTLASNIVSSASPLTLGGGTFQMTGSVAGSSQSFSELELSPGESAIVVNSNTSASNLNLGALRRGDGVVKFILPASGHIQITQTNAVLRAGTSNATYGFIADAGGNLIDYAVSDASGNLEGGSQITSGSETYTTNPTSISTNSPNFHSTVSNVMDFVSGGATTGLTMDQSWNVNGGLRFNTSRSGDWTIDTGAAGRILTTGGVLVTDNVGPYNVNFTGSGSVRCVLGITAEEIIAQDNPAGLMVISAGMSGSGQWIKIGKGTFESTGVGATANTYTGQTYIDEGTWLITNTSGLGSPSTGATVNLNGGSLVANGNVALDNSNGTGTSARAVVLASGMASTLAASTGHTLTISGLVSNSVTGTPASLAIGTGTVTGTGAGTENAALIGDGTVVLSNANTYSGATTINRGTLFLAAANAISSTTQVNLSGGTLATGGTNQGMGLAPLNVTANSILDFGAGASKVNFASSSGTWSGNLEIKNWNYGSDHLQMGVDGSGLSAAQLAQIHFDDFHTGASLSTVSNSVVYIGEVTPLVGDINQDGLLSTTDVAALMTALSNLPNYQSLHFSAAADAVDDVAFILDVNQDGHLDNQDLQAEITLLANRSVGTGSGSGSAMAVPEPGGLVQMALACWVLLLFCTRRCS